MPFNTHRGFLLDVHLEIPGTSGYVRRCRLSRIAGLGLFRVFAIDTVDFLSALHTVVVATNHGCRHPPNGIERLSEDSPGTAGATLSPQIRRGGSSS